MELRWRQDQKSGERSRLSFRSSLYVFTDIKGAAASRFSVQKWVVTPMAGADHDDRLIRRMFESPR
jgi:hypothetical protein